MFTAFQGLTSCYVLHFGWFYICCKHLSLRWNFWISYLP